MRGCAYHIVAYEPADYGIDSMDITSFHPDQQDWSADRAHRAPILTLWSEPLRSAPDYHIGCLLFNGRLILDYASNPIRAFRNLPLTISSAVKGFRLETWTRQDGHRLRIDDVRARMRTRNTPDGRQPLYKRGDLTDRSNAFRLKSGLISFRPKNHPVRLAARAYMDSLRTEAQKERNLATDQDLTPDQLADLKKLSKRSSTNAAAGSSAPVGISGLATASTPIAATTPTSQPTPSRPPSPAPQPSSSSPPTPLDQTITEGPVTVTPLSSATAGVSAPATASSPTATITPTSRPSRRRSSLASQPAPSTPPAPAPAPILPDSRDDVPETCKESYILGDALEETVEHFKKLTGQYPKPTNTASSYSARWDALQAQFEPIWRSQRPTEDIPSLYKLRAWTGGIKCWDADWRTQVGGEERDREGEAFGEYMDATQDGTAYIGQGGNWVSVRDTWCNSHLRPNQGRLGRRDPTSEEDSEEGIEENPEEDSDEEGTEDGSAGDSDDEFDDAE